MNSRGLMRLVLVFVATAARAEAPPKFQTGGQRSAGVRLTRDLWWTDTAERAAAQGAGSRSALPLIADTRAEAGDIEGAVRIARRFDEKGELWEMVAMAAARAGRTKDVERAIDAIRRAHYDKDALEAVATAQVDAGALDEAWETAALIDDQERHGRILVAVAAAEARAGRFEAARRAAEGIEDPVERVRALLLIADARITRGDAGVAQAEVVAALGRTAQIERLAERAQQVQAVLDRFFAIGALDDVARVLEAQAESMGILGVDALVRLAEARLDHGDRISAGQAASRAQRLIRFDKKTRLDPFGSVFRQEVADPRARIARVQVFLGDLAGARETIGNSSEGLVVLYKALFESGNQAGARSILEKELVRQCERYLQFASAVQVAQLQHASGDAAGASRTMEQVRRAIVRSRENSKTPPLHEEVVDKACELAENQVSGAAWLIDEARQTLALARERIDHLPAAAQSARRVSRVAVLAARMGDGEAAQALFEQAGHLAADDPVALTEVMTRRLAAKELQGVRAILDRVCNLIERRRTPEERNGQYSELVRSLVEGGHLDGAEVALERATRSLTTQAPVATPLNLTLERKGREFDRPREELALALLRAGRLDTALKLAPEITDIAGRVRVLGGVVVARIEAGRLDEAERIYQEIKAAVRDGIGGFVSDSWSTSQLVETTLPRALETARARAAGREGASRIWAAAVQRALAANAEMSRKALDRARLQAAPLLAATATGRLDAALALLESVSDPAVANAAMGKIARGLAGKDRAAAGRVVEEALRRNPRIIDADARDNDLQWIVATRARLGNPAAAERLTGRLVGAGRRGFSLMWLARWHADNGDMAEAGRLAEEARRALASEADPGRREKGLAWARDQFDQIRRGRPSAPATPKPAPAIDALGRSAAEAGRRISALVESAREHARAGDVTAAERLIAEARGIADGQADPLDRGWRRSDLARRLIQSGFPDAAGPIVADLEDAESRFALLLQLADQQVRRGRRDTALRTLEQAVAAAAARPESVYIRVRLATLAALQAKLGLFDAAEQTIPRIQDAESRLAALLDLARTSRENRDEPRASRLLKACWEIVETVPSGELGRLDWRPVDRTASDLARRPRDGDPAGRAARALRLASIQNAAGETRAARESIALASGAVGTISEDYIKSSLTLELAVMQARVRDVAGATATYRELSVKYDRWRAPSIIVDALVDSGDAAGAAQFLQQLPAGLDFDRDPAYDRVARALSDIAIIGPAERFARGITKAEQRIRTLRDLAMRQAERSDFDGARRTLEVALREASTVADYDERDDALERVAYGIFNPPQEDRTQGAGELMGTPTTRAILSPLADPEGVGRAIHFDRLEPLLRQALVAARAERERVPEGYLRALDDLAGLLAEVGHYAEAERLFVEALELRKAVAGGGSEEYAVGLDRLGSVFVRRGDYALAEPRIRNALTIRKAALGAEHSRYADSLDSLAGLLLMMGDDVRAEPLYRQSLAIRERSPGIDQDYAATAHNLGLLYERRGSFAEAEPLLRKCVELLTPPEGKATRESAHALSTLAFLLTRMERFDEAEKSYRKALVDFGETCGQDHPLTVRTVSNLGFMFLRKGAFAEAEPLLVRALGVRRENGWRLDVADSLNDLAAVRLGGGDSARALEASREALWISRGALELAATVQSQRQQLAMLAAFRERLDLFLSLTAEASTPPEETFGALLTWKGSVLSRQRRLRALAREGGAGELLRKLQEVSDQLAALALAQPGPAQRAAWQARVEELTERKEALEAQVVARAAPGGVDPGRDDPVERVRQCLPAETALVDFLEYVHTRGPDSRGGRLRAELRLLAVVVRRNGPIVRVDLGPAAPVTEAVCAWRAYHVDRSEPGARRPGARPPSPAAGDDLRRLVWLPLRPHLEGARTVLVSPDGALTRFPLAALPGSKPGTFLVEDHGGPTIVSVPVPQLLPDLLSRRGPGGGEEQPSLLVVHDVDYGLMPVDDAADPAATRSIPRRTWGDLDPVGAEAPKVVDLFRKTHPKARDRIQILKGDVATERVIRNVMPRQRCVHLATHGFYDPEGRYSGLGPEPGGPGFIGRRGAAGLHPGLLSWLLAAGANSPPQDAEDDGLLTALEIEALDLRSVELAVLSACKSGLGDEVGGEGLLGLQRAFQVAGARAVVASYWNAQDLQTVGFMTRFYRNVWVKKMSKAEALREAQLWLLHGQRGLDDAPGGEAPEGARAMPPYYWAAFALSGDWR